MLKPNCLNTFIGNSVKITFCNPFASFTSQSILNTHVIHKFISLGWQNGSWQPQPFWLIAVHRFCSGKETNETCKKATAGWTPTRCYHILPYLLHKQKALSRFSQWCFQFLSFSLHECRFIPIFFIFSTSFLSTVGPARPDSQADLELDGCMSSR